MTYHLGTDDHGALIHLLCHRCPAHLAVAAGWDADEGPTLDNMVQAAADHDTAHTLMDTTRTLHEATLVRGAAGYRLTITAYTNPDPDRGPFWSDPAHVGTWHLGPITTAEVEQHLTEQGWSMAGPWQIAAYRICARLYRTTQ